ncbi:MAG: NAD(P)H-dependent glycerol-3-phosphate dehydrogenase [Opitutales bacterium]
MAFAVLGAGAWGTAVAVHFARGGHSTFLVPRRQEHADALSAQRENVDYMPGVKFPEKLEINTDLEHVLRAADTIFLGCPSVGLRDLCDRITATGALQKGADGHLVISLAKGLEKSSLEIPSRVMESALDGVLVGAFSGPSFAKEISFGKPAALVLSAPDASKDRLQKTQEALSDGHMRVYLSDDLIGVELGGCLKNIYAIAAGIMASMELGSNASAAFLTRSLHEMVVLATSLGADPRTMYGLSGFGDLNATCSDDQSRNRSFGRRIGQGESAEAILTSQRSVVEGYWACECFYRLCKSKGLEAPILSEIYAVLYEGKSAQKALMDLMMRSLKEEH